ncbi:MAG: insulinase family protein [Oscillospiraceae bacterium]|jgi:Predicted Zn-dependent peptidases|nr:insulinase family protein [Oscillospiraceae bacterium]
MELTRTEILPGVWLSHLRTDKFKTACLSVTLLTQLRRETAAMNALIPYVLRRGTARSPDMEAISARLDALYGTAIEPVVRRVGEIQCLGFFASIPEEDYLPGAKGVLRKATELMGELLLSPATRGGLLLPRYVDSEKEKMLEAIRSRINDKRGYALFRCIEEMCCCEDFAVGRLGGESECEAIHYTKLSRHYKSLLQSCPIEIFYCGRAEKKQLVSFLRDALMTLPRGEIDYEIGTDVRMNALEEGTRTVKETLDVTQGKLVMGFRLGESMEEPDTAALTVFNAAFGGGTSSKLFANVRERLQLCYYAGSLVDVHKGLLLVSSGIEFDKFEAARDEILAQLAAIARGEVSDEELMSAKMGVASELRAMTDSQGELEGFTLTQALDGLDYGPLELAELVNDVTREQLAAIAGNAECDMIYFLQGGGSPADKEDEDAQD